MSSIIQQKYVRCPWILVIIFDKCKMSQTYIELLHHLFFLLVSNIMSQSKPINIPGRRLASSVPPQGGNPPMFSPPQPCASSFDQYCGHLESASYLRDQWKKHVRSYKDSNFLNSYQISERRDLKPISKQKK